MAGSTFLVNVNAVLRHFNEVQLTSSTFAAATGFQSVVQDYVNETIREIQQSEYEWPFNWNQSTQALTVGIVPNVYALDATCESVDWESFMLQADLTLTNPVNQLKLPYQDYDYWLQNDAGTEYTQHAQVAAGTATYGVQPPKYVYRTQDLQFGLANISDQIYHVTYEWWGYPSELSLYSDTTTVPSRFDHVIRKGAIAMGYAFRGDQAQFQLWDKKKEDGIDKMRELLINRYKIVRDARVRRAG